MSRRRKPPFEPEPGAPPPLVESVNLAAGFDLVDLMGIVWHGHYPRFFEAARGAHGERYGLDYQAFVAARLRAPVATLDIDYKGPLRLGDRFTVEAALHWSEAARLNYVFTVTRADGALCARAWSTQLLVDEGDEVCLAPPPLIEDLRKRWGEEVGS